MRWPHAQWGMMQPDQFIALAEETGHIVPLGSWVLGQAAADVAQWVRRLARTGAAVRQRERLGPPVPRPRLRRRRPPGPGRVGPGPSALMLELTESVLLRRDERIHADLAELKAIGVRLAIDDFGTGYSSLSYLRELPIDVLKIDKSFVDGIADFDQRLALVEGIVRIAGTLQLCPSSPRESKARSSATLLVSMGCQYGQGYLLAMPVEADEAEALMRVGRSLVPELPRMSADHESQRLA